MKIDAIEGHGRIMVALALLTIVLFARVTGNAFVDMDDELYVTDQPLARGGLTCPGVGQAFLPRIGHWHPLTWISHMADVSLFGMNPAGHHASSVLLHAANVVLLYLALFTLTGARGPSAVVAGLFACHPLNVEAVASVSSRKELVAGCFWFLTVFLYARRARKPSPKAYVMALGGFVLALMSKPIAVTLPVVLLLLDFWPLGRIRTTARGSWRRALAGAVLEKIPFFVLSLASCAMTMYAARVAHILREPGAGDLVSRVTTPVVSYATYLTTAFIPVHLAIYYPLPEGGFPVWRVAWSFGLLASVTVLALALARRAPYLLAGWGWFVVVLLPVIGLVEYGNHFQYDRYMYLPLAGLLVAVTWAAGGLVAALRIPGRFALVPAVAVAAVFAGLSWIQMGYWRNPETVYAHTLRVTKDNYIIHNNLGLAYLARDEYDKAREEFWLCEHAKGGEHKKARNNTGLVFLEQDHLEEAARVFESVLQEWPDFAMAWLNLGLCRARQGNTADAVRCFEKTIALDPEDPDAYLNLGIAALRGGNLEEAMARFIEARRRNPHDAEIRDHLGTALARMKRFDEAIIEFETAVQLDPRMTRARFNLATALEMTGRRQEAAKAYRAVLDDDPDFAPAQQALRRLADTGLARP